jgi:hypothetical protein
MRTANSDGAAVIGSLEGDERSSALKSYRRFKISEEGTGSVVAKELCIPFGGVINGNVSLPHRVMVAPNNAPASSTDKGNSYVMDVIALCVFTMRSLLIVDLLTLVMYLVV